MAASTKVTFTNRGPFTDALNSAVDRFLEDHPELIRRARRQLVVKAITALLFIFGSYASLLVLRPGLPFRGLCLVGLILGAILTGFCIQHDANHGATFRSTRWNHLLGWFSSDVLLGFGSHMWRVKHNVAHHQYPNIEKKDPDAEQAPFLQLNPHQSWRRWYRLQAIYAWAIYPLMGFRMQFAGDILGYRAGWVGETRLAFPKGWCRVGFFAGKALFIGWTLVLPCFFYPWWGVLGCYAIVVAALGLVMTTVFQLAHCHREAAYRTRAELAKEDREERVEWSLHQLATTADFSPRNRILSWWLGGLNFQAVHHLFDHLPHPLYPRLAPIVARVAQEYQERDSERYADLRYVVFPSVWSALSSHIRHLWVVGNLGQSVEYEMG